jgi:hypothetical protein
MAKNERTLGLKVRNKMAKANKSIIHQRIINRTNQIKVGRVYFLSSFYDKDGAFVKVTSKSTKTNKAGWPSSVSYEVIEKVGEHNSNFYAVGNTGICNATNLYEQRESASTAARKNS